MVSGEHSERQKTVRLKKIRGHRRRQKKIELWRQSFLTLDKDYLSQRQKTYVKIYVHPYSGISLTNSITPQPYGKTKHDILKGLLDIYASWKIELDTLKQPYYLKIWLFEPRFSTSQVVCAIGDMTEFYNNTFNKADHLKELPLKNYSRLADRMAKFKWDLYLDEDHHDSTEILERNDYASTKDYEDDKKWFSRLLKKPHTTHKLPGGGEMYNFKRGHVWVGGQ